ncbi:UNVERIFIED_CONTAM: hypothetical protein FKN15_027283 [Acipenser sinensis]
MVQSENSSAANGSTPNPSILLALRLASYHDRATERSMLGRLQADAVKRVEKGLPFTSGTVALYCLAMQACCADPSLTPAPGLKGGKKALDLRKLLERKLKEEIENIENPAESPLPLVPLAPPAAQQDVLTVHYTVEDGLRYTFNDLIDVTVPTGSSLLRVMEEAAKISPAKFRHENSP